MIAGPQLLLVGAVAGVGVLHTIVPDHWVPITLIARQRGWTRGEVARAALQAGTGHVVSTLIIAVLVWLAGAAFAQRFGNTVDTLSSVALIAFGAWIALSSWRELHGHGGHGHGHSHGHHHHHHHGDEAGEVHGPERQTIATHDSDITLSIFETGQPPKFRLSGPLGDSFSVTTRREDGAEQKFQFVARNGYWESADAIPEPHQFSVTLAVDHHGHGHAYEAAFAEHDHGHHDHSHAGHSHAGHSHAPKTSSRTALLLIVGSSPMIEGIPAFFAAGRYGPGLIAVMAAVFAVSTIATYVLLCVFSTAGLQRVRLGAFERYGEVLSGVFIMLVGAAFWVW